MGHATRAKVVSLARQWPLARPRRGEENRQRSNATDRRLVMGATSLSTTAYRRRIRRGNDPPRGYRTAHIENERARRRSRRWRKRRFVQCLGERPSFAGPARIADAIGLDTRRNRPRATGLAPPSCTRNCHRNCPTTAPAPPPHRPRRRPRTDPARRSRGPNGGGGTSWERRHSRAITRRPPWPAHILGLDTTMASISTRPRSARPRRGRSTRQRPGRTGCRDGRRYSAPTHTPAPRR
jgi:hypothetical protein